MVADKKTRGTDKEDELLLQDFSRRVSAKSSALFYGNAFIVSSIPIWLYWRIHAVDIASTGIILAIVTLVSTWLVAFAYRNTKHVLKHKVAVKREAAVAKDMNKEVIDFWLVYDRINVVMVFYIAVVGRWRQEDLAQGEGRADLVEEERGGRVRGHHF